MRRKLEAAGFAFYSQKGSHVKPIRKDGDGVRAVIVPAHKEIAVGPCAAFCVRPVLRPKISTSCKRALIKRLSCTKAHSEHRCNFLAHRSPGPLGFGGM
ncbi:type II toxin-antitoxin system HicA family toxin [Oceanithermus sp.]|uniref:type II toxin-antitoxin system HicA family toxin n=1 Tax=Oceanithermus sp. TaxID=2268145 RepID=UPI00343DDCA1